MRKPRAQWAATPAVWYHGGVWLQLTGVPQAGGGGREEQALGPTGRSPEVGGAGWSSRSSWTRIRQAGSLAQSPPVPTNHPLLFLWGCGRVVLEALLLPPCRVQTKEAAFETQKPG